MTADPHAHLQQKKLHRLSVPVEAVVITVSDRCAAGQRPDRSGPLAVELLASHGITCREHIVCADGIPAVSHAIRTAIDTGARIIFTTGGTGVTARDLTPEATVPFLAVQLPQIVSEITAKGLRNTPLASLSRAVIGITSREPDAAIIVNAPGSQGGVKDTISVVGPLVPHLLEQIDPDHFAPQ